MPGPWRLRYGTVDVEFSNASGIFLREAPAIGDYDIADEDTDNNRADGSDFGEDFHGGRTIGVTFGIVGRNEQEMWDRFGILSQLWDAEAVRRVPGAVAELVSDRGRAALGRPRKITPSNVFPEARMITVETTFRQREKAWYGDPQSQSVGLALSQGGGLVAPLKSPLVARGYTTRQNTFTVDGDLPAWPTVTVRSSILNPVVTVPGRFRFAAATTLKYDEDIAIDTFRGTVLRNGTQMAALTRSSSLLEDAALDPGSYALVLSGSSSTGNPTADIDWRPAFTTP